MSGSVAANPTASISLNFAAYVAAREQELGNHLVDGVPDYGFSMDLQIRRRLIALKPARVMADTLTAALVPHQRQLEAMQGIVVGPKQLPEIHALAEDCAHRLGIGVPRLFINPSNELNAFTIATTDVAPIIVLSRLLVETLDLEELRFVIGHECGHVHNLHGTYLMIAEMLTNPMADALLASLAVTGPPGWLFIGATKMLQQGLTIFFRTWSRCAEVTADRAGLICCGDLSTAQNALAKLITGGGARLAGTNFDELIKQIQTIGASPQHLTELMADHPLIPRRLAALALFAECAVLASWRPDKAYPATLRDKGETDRLCAEVVGVIHSATAPLGAVTAAEAAR